jgi:hypothetical protein
MVYRITGAKVGHNASMNDYIVTTTTHEMVKRSAA